MREGQIADVEAGVKMSQDPKDGSNLVASREMVSRDGSEIELTEQAMT